MISKQSIFNIYTEINRLLYFHFSLMIIPMA